VGHASQKRSGALLGRPGRRREEEFALRMVAAHLPLELVAMKGRPRTGVTSARIYYFWRPLRF
jgi:hypothetical protein